MTFATIITKVVSTIISPLVVLIIGWAVVVFIWNLLKYLRGDGNKKGEALAQIGWGILVLFVMVSLWGLVGILSGTFTGWGGSNTAPRIPYFNSGSTGGSAPAGAGGANTNYSTMFAP